MATKAASMTAFGGAHTAGIFSDMTVDGPVIGTLVVIMDRARNLPNKRTMGKQDPYCAARLGKEAKKTKTDKRGGQTPRWDQELRFTVHDSPDYHRLKVSVFNDDRKTELIGDTWVSLDCVLTPGGGQADDWHGLNCKGKYAGEVRIELTYYDTRPKAEKPVLENRRDSSRAEGQSAAVGGPRESTPIKRRPLPTDPTGVTPSPVNTPEHRGLRGVRAGPRELGSPRHSQPVEPPPAQRTQSDTPLRRPVPEATSQSATPTTSQNTPQRPQMPQEAYSTPPNPRSSNPRIPLPREESFDMSYAAPKPYEVQSLDPVPQHVREHSHHRTMSQDDYHPRGQPQQQQRIEPAHTHSAPAVPTQHHFEPQVRQLEYQEERYPGDRRPSYSQDHYQDPAYQVAPLRTARSREYSHESASPHDPYGKNRYIEAPSHHDVSPSHRRRSAMQPMVEDEDDMPPPPPIHRPGASTIPQAHQDVSPSTSYHEEAPAPLSFGRHREEFAQPSYEMQPHSYNSNSYNQQPHSERRYTHPRVSTQPSSRPESRDAMAPSPLRQETSTLPSSLIAGLPSSRRESEVPAYEAPPAYETPPRLRQYSEPAEYRAITQYETTEPSQQLVHHASSQYTYDYPHDPPEQPRRRSPVYDPVPIVKPRATSPAVDPRYSPNPGAERSSRGPVRSMPTRKSVSPRPPPSADGLEERRLSRVAFNPDSFDVYNPRVSRSPIPSDDELERPGSRMEYNDKGQIVTFSGRVVDASDHLPIDNWAPEPVPKGTVKEKSSRSRVQLNGSRDLDAARQREERYQRERAERERIRHSASTTFDTPSNALVTSRHDFDHYESPGAGALVLAGHNATPPNSSGRNRLQKRPDQRQSMSYEAPLQRHSPSVSAPDSHVLRERHNPNSYGSSPGYGRHGEARQGAPPIPAKIPIDMSGNYTGGNNEDMALSLELQSIDIGPASGARRPRTQAQPRRQYGY
ncbi:hypothetical protein ACN47E_004252 [Coniothyrium glycines]